MKMVEEFYQSIISAAADQVEERILERLQHMNIKDRTLDIREASEYTLISEKLLYRLCQEKQIPHIRAGVQGSKKPKILFRQSTLDSWMREQERLNYREEA
ncbi:helix-turn-helix domain-containing protein [Halalkalibacterium halodurans]|jgi:predicted DNA-binding transcriptional regulator AlpA|uniref:helix-turn-helix domain-containing protein n=1 Tax=Halalkalibacterium halodurans TaxID=86665 RepID=UPI002E212805|nr:helix-turn-helix domain-containing protein [Halalkalibacterium halodurans]MED4172343.1 helix-turn-helix domain-containing protein [Halalkalibacterium halodurans]